ncbi:hypothetical protein [Rahnella sikkimica]|uniref:Uncharacterized protein n=1 Tax=Rahnella sikkimica TaxID=1805933 RepID=A0A2L1UZ82_9GAMM|nr:hypothetical protein [Rahnella sikkimica]AVF38207.1 hypothetical protein BV494_25350 [Rahnella sikkimica]
MVKRLCIFTVIFLFGWSACLGLLGFTYHYNFTTGGDGDLRPMLTAFIVKQCRDENKGLMNEVVKNRMKIDDYFISSFECQNKKSDKIIYQMSMASAGYQYMACVGKAESTGENERLRCKSNLDMKIAIIKAVGY